MAEKTFVTRIQLRNDTSENWGKVSTFVPLAGEVIFYKDLNKFQIGDGTKSLAELPFFTECHGAKYTFSTSAETHPGKIIVKANDGSEDQEIDLAAADVASAAALAAAEDAIDDLEEKVDLLTNVSPLKFAGALPNGTPSKEDDESAFNSAVAELYDEKTPAEGDVIICGNKEYARYNNQWVALGDEGQYAIKGQIKDADVADDAAIEQSKIAGYFDPVSDDAEKSLENDMAFIEGIIDTYDEAISDLSDVVGDENEGLVKDVNDLKELVNEDGMINPDMIAPTSDSVEDQNSDGIVSLVDELVEMKNAIEDNADKLDDYLKDYKTMDEDEVLAEATLINPEKIGSVLFEGQIVEKDPPMATMADDLNSLKDSVDNLNDFVFGREGSESGTVTPLNGLVNDVADLQEAIDGIEAVSYVPETISGTAVKLGTLTIGENSYDIKAPAGEAPVMAAQYMSDLAGSVNPDSDFTEIIISGGGAPAPEEQER